MFAKTVAGLCLLLAIFIVGASSLRCNLCIGSLDSDCAHNESVAAVKQTCKNITGHGAELKSLNNLVDKDEDQSLDTYCVFVTLQDNDATTSLIERGCGYIYHGQDICSFMKKVNKDVLSCDACQKDMCN